MPKFWGLAWLICIFHPFTIYSRSVYSCEYTPLLGYLGLKEWTKWRKVSGTLYMPRQKCLFTVPKVTVLFMLKDFHQQTDNNFANKIMSSAKPLEYSGTQGKLWSENVSFNCILQVSKWNPKKKCKESRYSEADQSFVQPRIFLAIIVVTMYVKNYREESKHSIWR